jgi:hypothetical protein
MRLFLDTEFNGFQGKLMSMALVPENNSIREFYVEIEMQDPLDDWVKENVVPHMYLQNEMNVEPFSRKQFQNLLAQYLWEVGECTIVADWPDDIRHFCESLITGPGMCLSMLHNIKFELDFGIEYESLVPHNALHDARGIRDFYMRREKR